ncbi:copper resistance protein CopZ [Paenibacillus selenitireducens]|jgi:copper chaperone|uniref:Copper resistance protein CopZ n=1 Tax=Paenibacillus selenitireducens TaxID=1324314 RepID=A0A1T2X4U6_9BACL|nr:copper ion binding protein [Paenibacillus selenitireducens]OPA74593.1 copper resistance protein CopZ [Paenibacillus selenitireducens]
MEHVTLKVEGMSCNHCVQSVEGALKNIGASGKVDLANGTVAVEFDAQKVTPEQIKEAITDQGYDIV